jgi:GMP synthase PP-ATPase subunit
MKFTIDIPDAVADQIQEEGASVADLVRKAAQPYAHRAAVKTVDVSADSQAVDSASEALRAAEESLKAKKSAIDQQAAAFLEEVSGESTAG